MAKKTETKTVEPVKGPTKQEINLEEIRKMREGEQKLQESMMAIKYDSFSPSAYKEMDSYVKMVAKQLSTGLLLEGPAGVGKTYRTLQIVNKEVGAENMAYTDSFATPAALYIWLYQNRDKAVVILDDVAGLMSSNKALAMMKGGLWEVNGKRIITYLTTKPLKDEEGEEVPGHFDLGAGMIVLTNYLDKKNPHIQAVLSRINYCRLEVGREELLKIMEHIVKKDYKDLTLEERTEVFDYLKEQSAREGFTFNLRTLIKAFQFKEFAKMSTDQFLWKNLVLMSLDKKDEMLILEAIFKDKALDTEEKRADKFTEITTLDKRTYFRRKKDYEREYGKVSKPVKWESAPMAVEEAVKKE